MRWFVAVVLVLIIGLGGAAFYAARLARERDVEVIVLTAVWAGASPEDVERSVSVPLESAVMSTRGLVEARSESRSGVSIVTLVVRREGRDGFLIVQEVRERLEKVLNTLPQSVSPPSVSRMMPPQRAVHQRFVVRSSELAVTEVSRWVEWEFRRKLEMQNGVRVVELCGIVEDAVEILPDLPRLAAYGIKPLEFVEAIERANLDIPGGRLDNGGSQFLIRASGNLKSVEDLRNIRIKPEVRLLDVATVMQTGAPQPCVAYENGMRVVSADVVSDGPLEKPLELPEVPRSISLKEVKPVRSETWAVEDERGAAKVSHAGLALKHDDGSVELLVDPAANAVDFEKVRQTPGVALMWKDGDSVVRVSGEDLEVLNRTAEVVRAKLIEAFPAHTVGAKPRSMKPELQIIPRERSGEVARLIAFALGGSRVATLRDGERELEVSVKIEARNPEGLLDLLRGLQLSDGRPLSTIVEVQTREAPAVVTRVNARRTVELHTSAPAGEVRKALEGVALDVGVSISVP
ncbi:MAG: efflux RND transporter permease subunit [Archangium sp.]